MGAQCGNRAGQAAKQQFGHSQTDQDVGDPPEQEQAQRDPAAVEQRTDLQHHTDSAEAGEEHGGAERVADSQFGQAVAAGRHFQQAEDQPGGIPGQTGQRERRCG